MQSALVLSRAAVRELDRRAIEEYGLPSLLLMENAGRACADEAERLLAAADRGEVLVLCGPGNNGGDGLVIARTLSNRGHAVRLVFTGTEERLARCSDDVRTNARLWRGLGHELELRPDAPALAALAPALQASPLVVDALFGTGLARPLAEPYLDLVRAVNEHARRTLAVDVPSGLDADTGEELGAAVRADTTVTFVAAKPGFTRAAGPACCGEVVVAEIGIPRAFVLSATAARR